MKKRLLSLFLAGMLCVSSSLSVLADTGSISDIALVNQNDVSTVTEDTLETDTSSSDTKAEALAESPAKEDSSENANEPNNLSNEPDNQHADTNVSGESSIENSLEFESEDVIIINDKQGAVEESGEAGTIASGTCGTNLTWTLSDTGLLRISGTGDMTNWSGDPVWYSQRESIKRVIIDPGVTSIGTRAFFYCTNLYSVSIANGVLSIGNQAFFHCESLNSLVLPESLTSVGYEMITGTRITTITIPKNVTNCNYSNASSSVDRRFGMTAGADLLTEVIFEDGIKFIPDCICSNFNHFSSIIKIVIPDSVVSIGAGAFCRQEKLEDIRWSQNLQSIGEKAFLSNKSIREIVFPKTLNWIGIYSFEDCSELKKISFIYNSEIQLSGSRINLQIGEGAFWNCVSLTTVNLSENVTVINPKVFGSCSSLSTLVLPESLTSVGFEMIAGTRIASITIPKNVTNCTYNNVYSGFDRDFGMTAGADLLTEVIFEDGIKFIPDCICNNYNHASSISKIVIPDSVISIGNAAFWIQDKLSDVYYEGDSSQWNAIVINSYNDPIINATRHYNSAVVSRIDRNATSASFDRESKPTKSSESYGGESVSKTNEEILQEGFIKLNSAIEQYLSLVNNEISAEARTAGSTTSQVDEIEILMQDDQARRQPVLTFLATDKDNTELMKAAYSGLREYYNQLEKQKPTISKIKIKSNIVEIESKLISEIKKGIIAFNTSFNYSKKYSVEVNCQGVNYSWFDFSPPSFGSITVRDRYTNKQTVVVLCSDRQTVAKSMAVFFQGCIDLEEDVIKQGLNEYYKVFKQVSGISEAFSKLSEETANKVYEFLTARGFGKVIKYLLKIDTLHKQVKELSKSLTSIAWNELIDNPTKFYDNLVALDVSDSTVQKTVVKNALKEIKDAQAELELYLYNYIYHPDQALDMKRGFIDRQYNKFISVKCPVDVTVYDADNVKIGYTQGDYCEFDSNILIKVEGDAKYVYVPGDLDVRIELTGTSSGTMSYTVEEYSEGIPVGRANYFDIPLYTGSTYTQTITADTDIARYDELYLYTDAGESISANEYLDAETSNALVEVKGYTTEGGFIYGAGTYVRGDEVSLTALPDEGYNFKGWYINNKFVSISTMYQFTATEDTVIQALFMPLKNIQTISCEDSYTINLSAKMFNLDAKTNGDGELYYYVDDDQVADISNDGTVTVVGEGTTTLYVVAAETDTYLQDIREIQLNVVKNGGMTPDMSVTGYRLYGYQVVLNGNFDLKYYVELTDEMMKRNDITMRYTIGDTVYETSCVRKTGNYQIFMCELGAAQIADSIVAELIFDGESHPLSTYSVREYLETLIQNPEQKAEFMEAKDLAEALLTYSAHAQKYFHHNLADPADRILNPDYMNTISDTDVISSISGEIVDNLQTADFYFYGASLICETDTYLRIYFTNKNNLTLEQILDKYTINILGISNPAYETGIKGNLFYITIKDIPAAELDSYFSIYLNTDQTTSNILYSPAIYIRTVLESAGMSAELKNLCKALWLYNQAANNYYERYCL